MFLQGSRLFGIARAFRMQGAKNAFVNSVFSGTDCTSPIFFNNVMSNEMRK
jgi:hypothetical protein